MLHTEMAWLYSQNWYCTLVPPVATAVKVMGVFTACGEAGAALTETAVSGGLPVMVSQSKLLTAAPVASCAVTESRYAPAAVGVHVQVVCAE